MPRVAFVDRGVEDRSMTVLAEAIVLPGDDVDAQLVVIEERRRLVGREGDHGAQEPGRFFDAERFMSRQRRQAASGDELARSSDRLPVLVEGGRKAFRVAVTQLVIDLLDRPTGPV